MFVFPQLDSCSGFREASTDFYLIWVFFYNSQIRSKIFNHLKIKYLRKKIGIFELAVQISKLISEPNEIFTVLT